LTGLVSSAVATAIDYVFLLLCLYKQSLTLHFVVLSFDRYSRDDVIGEVLLPVCEALESATATDATLDQEKNIGNQPDAVLVRDIAPRSLKVSVSLLMCG